MGFAKIAELTHHMEDVFELLRQRSSGLPAEAIDTVFACLDALSAAAESIETDGEEALDPTPLVTRLRSLVRPRTAEQEMAATAASRSQAARGGCRPCGRCARPARPCRASQRRDDAGRSGAHGARRRSGSRRGAGQHSRPGRAEQFQGREISAWVASDHEDEPIIENLSGVSEVASVTVADVTHPDAEAEPAVPAPAPDQPAPVPAAPAAAAAAPLEAAPGLPRPSRLLPPPRRPKRTPRRRGRSEWTPSGSTRSCTRWANS